MNAPSKTFLSLRSHRPWRRMPGAALLSALLVLNLALAAAGQVASNQITAVNPDRFGRGVAGLPVTLTLDTDVPPAPPVEVMPESVTIGTLVGTSVTRPDQYTVTAVFDLPADEPLGAHDVTVSFQTPMGTLAFTAVGGFNVTDAAVLAPGIVSGPASQAVAAGGAVTFTVVASGSEPLAYQWRKDDVDIAGATDATLTIDPVSTTDAGSYCCVVSNDHGTAVSAAATLTVTTDPPFAGYNLIAPMMSTETYFMDNDGNIVHTWTSSYRPGLAAYFLEDGTLLRTANTNDATFNVGGAGGRVEQYDWDGNLVWSYDCSTAAQRQHHDVEMLPNGNVLLIAWERKTEAEALAAGRDPALLDEAELWPDMIIEVAPDGAAGGTVVWEWHVWDHLVQDVDPTAPNHDTVADRPERVDLNHALSGAADWTHINAVDYHAELDQILLSVHNFNEVWVIDHSTTTAEAAGSTGGNSGKGGDLLYRWGNPQAYGRGTAADQQFFAQHDAEWIGADCPGAGDILVFNNGPGRPGGNYSSVDQFTPPLNPDGSYTLVTDAAYGPAELAWSYTATPAADFYAMRISGAQRLANGNTLVCEGTEGRLFEVTAGGSIVWQYDHAGELFRVDRYAPDYAGFAGTQLEPETPPAGRYPVVDTGQTACYDDMVEISPPAPGAAFYGQDAQHAGRQPSYTLTDGGMTVTDNVTGLMWTRSCDLDGDGDIDADDKRTYAEAVAYPATINATGYAGYQDWRLPSIKELYSLMNFTGVDPSGYDGDTSGLVPFIDTDYFDFGYGDSSAGERIIDAQFASTTLYLSTTMGGNETMFGLNLADGRIKGYPTSKAFYVYLVRGNPDYGVNQFVDNGDGTVTDQATGLMWSQADSGAGLNWAAALAWVEARNAENHLGHNDWRLPDAKELQSIVDYTRCPDTGSAAIDPVFDITAITNEGGQLDYPWFWSSTTHANMGPQPGRAAAYVCFGRALGYWMNAWNDVHGAGAQRSDTKDGDLSSYTYVPDGYYSSIAPQGDAARLYNHVRLVRDVPCGEAGYLSNLAGDLNGDCYVSLPDVAMLAGAWMTAYGLADLTTLAQNWLSSAGAP